jgi:hypothetical protein
LGAPPVAPAARPAFAARARRNVAALVAGGFDP